MSLESVFSEPVVLFYGSDAYVLETRLNALLDQLRPKASRDFDFEDLDGSALSVSEVLILAESQPFIHEKKIIVIRQPAFLGLTAKQKSATNKKLKAEQGKILSYIQNPNPRSVLILSMQSGAKPTAFIKGLLQHPWAVLCEPLEGKELFKWLDQMADQHGKSWHPAAKRVLQEIQPYVTTAHMMQEAEKALLFSSEKQVSETDVRKILSPTPQYSIFNLIDAVVDGSVEKALHAWRDCAYLGENAGKVIYMLGDAFRRILMVQSLHQQGYAISAIQQEVGRPAFVVRKSLKQGEKIKTQRLVNALDLLLHKDMQRKTIPGIQETTFVEELLVLLIDRLHHQDNDTGNRGKK